MRKLLLVALVLAMAAPAWALTISPGSVQDIPTTYNTRLGRPQVSAGQIVASGLISGGASAQFYNVGTAVLTPVGYAENPDPIFNDVPPRYWSVSPSGFTQNDKVGVSGSWAVFDGGNDVNSKTDWGWVLHYGQSYRLGDSTSMDQNFFDIDANGKSLYVRWNIDGQPGSTTELMYKDWVNNPGGTPVAILSSLTTTSVGTSLNASLADGGSGKFTWSGNGGTNNTHYIFDLSDMSNHLVYQGATGVNVLRSRISDDGNWIVWNERNAGESIKRADIMLQNVSDPDSPGVAVNLTNNKDRIREDPNIEILDANTAIIVWGESAAPETATSYYIKAAVVEGLLSTPVITQEITVASEVGVATLRFPDVDGNIITWARNPESAGAKTQFVIIPEPATLALLGLGVLALARRR